MPGTSFITGGLRSGPQLISEELNDMNHTLLTIGVLSLLLPAAMFAAMRTPDDTTGASQLPITDASRDLLLRITHGIAVLLIVVFVPSSFLLPATPLTPRSYVAFVVYSWRAHNKIARKLGDDDDDEYLWNGEPEINQYVGTAAIFLCLAVMVVTAEWVRLSLSHHLSPSPSPTPIPRCLRAILTTRSSCPQ